MAEAVIGPLLGKIQQLAASEGRALVAVSEEIESLRNKLILIQAFLWDTDLRRRAMSDEFTGAWVQQIRDAVFDAQDAVDQYFFRVDLSRYPSWTHTTIRFLSGFTTQIRLRHILSREIVVINKRLDEIIKNKDVYRIEEAPGRTSIRWTSSSTTTFLATTKLGDLYRYPLVKREEEMKKLENALFRPSPDRQVVISIFGRSGVGKTSLVRDVYDRYSTKNHFGCQAWASFPPNYSAVNILSLVLQQITDDSTPHYTNSEIKQKLEEELKKDENQKYLFVIDAEVNSIEWKTLLMALPPDKCSRVVQITHNRPEAPPASSFEHVVIEVDRFSEDATIELFCQRVCVEENGQRYNDDVRRGIAATRGGGRYRQAILDITEGLPLAVVLLSGLLRTKEYPGEWRAVFDQLMSKQSRRLDSILSLCFDDLPHDIKSCFLYFAAFPPKVPIKASTLVCLWMAEGFLRSKEGMTMERVGHNYLKELVARNLVDLTLIDYLICDNKLVTVHDHVNAFLCFQAQQASFVEIHSSDDFLPLTSARRLSLQNFISRYAVLQNPMPKLWSVLSSFGKEKDQDDMPWKEAEGGGGGGGGASATAPAAAGSFPTCCTCLSSSSHGATRSKRPRRRRRTSSCIRQLLQGSKFLRVIHLHGLEIGDRLPDEIANVMHLQYLRITSCSLREIPPSIGRLINLQTLNVRGTQVKVLPESFWKISTLRHVFGDAIIFPRRIDGLKHIQTLESIRPDEEFGWDEYTLAQMTYLSCLFIRVVPGTAGYLSAALKKARYLNKLMHLKLLHIAAAQEDGLVIPSTVFTETDLPRLEIMEVKGKLDVPSELMEKDFCLSLPNLTQLSLERTQIAQEFIDKLAMLPFLSYLALYPGSYIGNKLTFAPRGFYKLKTIMIDLKELKTIEIQEKALPEIEDPHIFVFEEDFEILIFGSRPHILKKIKMEDANVYRKVKQILSVS